MSALERRPDPVELNLMTSGRAVAHSQESPPPSQRPARLHGIQLWIALPEERRHAEPGFAHHAELPSLTDADGVRVTVVAGEFRGERSPAAVYTPLVGDAWVSGEFGEVPGYAGGPLPAPPLPPGELRAR
jgi:redox-sensitive bicupin YhaK (pirin superfamily)